MKSEGEEIDMRVNWESSSTWKRRRILRRGAPAAVLLFLLLASCVPSPSPEAETRPSGEALGDRWTFTDPAYSAASLRNVDKIFSTRTVPRSGPVYELDSAPDALAGFTYEFEGERHTLDEFVERTVTTGLLVAHRRTVLFEAYAQGADESSRFLSFSVAKSVVSTLVGIAVGEGRIESVDDPVTRYVPGLSGSAYDGVPIKAILQMSSGIAFDERYDDPESEVYKRVVDPMRDPAVRLHAVAAGIQKEREPGTRFHYASYDAEVLGWLLAEVSGTTLSSYAAEKLWGPLGAERDAYWMIDHDGPSGVEGASIGFNATLRDYARFGLLMAFDGALDERRILPKGWVAEATVPDRPHLQPGRLYSGYPLGYQYQWWCFPGDHHAFTAQGIYGQFVVVDPVLDLVVVKTSNWPTPWVLPHELELYALFDALSARVSSDSVTQDGGP